jgi:hypothetical protein
MLVTYGSPAAARVFRSSAGSALSFGVRSRIFLFSVCGICAEPSVGPWTPLDRVQVCLMAARSKPVLTAQDPVFLLDGTLERLESKWCPQVRFRQWSMDKN